MKVFVEPKPRKALVKTLVLDPNNPRLRLHPGGSKEPDIIERLCKLKSQSPGQIIKMMIADRGYINSMIPTVYKEKGSSKLLVIDGNRRVAALKMVLNPSLIPSTRHGLRSDCEKLRGLVPSEVHYWVTQNKSDAARIVYRAHNNGTRDWETLARYASHYDSYQEGQSIADISEYTGTPQKQIKSEINAWLLIEAMISNIPDFQIDDDGITNFERVTTNYSKLPQLLGFRTTEEGVYAIPENKEIAEAIYNIYLNSAKAEPGPDGQAFTRKVSNNDEAREKFLRTIVPDDFASRLGNSIQSAAVSPVPKGASDSKESIAGGHSNPASISPPKPNSAIPQPQSTRQVLSIQKNVGRKSHLIMKEFNSLSSSDYPIACAALARAMIESTLKHHAIRLRCYTESQDLQASHRGEALDTIANKLKKEILSKTLPFSSGLIAAISSCIKSVPELNDVMHKEGSFAARPAVQSSLDSLASAVESLIAIPTPS